MLARRLAFVHGLMLARGLGFARRLAFVRRLNGAHGAPVSIYTAVLPSSLTRDNGSAVTLVHHGRPRAATAPPPDGSNHLTSRPV